LLWLTSSVRASYQWLLIASVRRIAYNVLRAKIEKLWVLAVRVLRTARDGRLGEAALQDNAMAAKHPV
jgi:hypothetical protein